MANIYKTFFGFTKEPFVSNIEIDQILVTKEIKAIYERFDYAVRLGSLALVTGDVGSGKSTALRWVTNKLHPSEFKVLWVTASTGSILELYRQLLSALKIDITSQSRAVLTKIIRKSVSDLILEKKQKPVIVIDEASLLRLEVFMELHTITQFECDSKPWLPIILTGQNQLVDKLQYRQSAPLTSRVVARSHLSAIEKKDMQTYILHHLNIAGVKANIFSDSAITAIHQGAGGLYRKANHLARGGLIAASKEKSNQVSSDHIRIASSEIF